MRTLYFDTYALLELVKGGANYQKYSVDTVIVTSKLNLLELHHVLFLREGKKFADETYDSFTSSTIEFDDITLKKASELRATIKKRNVSYIDCIGYILALSRGIPFLTGDTAFANMTGVEFVL